MSCPRRAAPWWEREHPAPALRRRMTPSPIEQHLQRAERRAVETLALRPVALPDRFAQAKGLWKDAPVSLTTRAFEGDAVTMLRVAYVTGVHLSLGTLLATPRPNRALPVLSIDLARLGTERDALVAVDLTPMSEGGARLDECDRLAAALPRAPLAVVADRPAWSRDWLSPNAVHARVGAARLADTLVAVDQSVDVWIALAAGAEPVPEGGDAVRARQHAYAEARRADEQWLSLLGSMFGRAWWGEYVEKVLFPIV
jgi:hypothetical protein